MNLSYINNLSNITIGYFGSKESYCGSAAKMFRNHFYNLVFDDDFKIKPDIKLDEYINKAFGKIKKPRLMAVPSVKRLVEKVEHGEIDYGVLPYETSVVGEIKSTNDILSNNDNLKICGLITMPTQIYMYSIDNYITPSTIQRVISDKNSIKQTEKTIKEGIFRNRNFFVIQDDVEDSSIAAKNLSKGLYDEDTAVLCSKEAGSLYGLSKVYSNVEDNDNNHTSFVLFSNNINIQSYIGSLDITKKGGKNGGKR